MSNAISENSLVSLIAGGKLPVPPAAELLGLKVEKLTRGDVELSFVAGATFLNPAGRVQGGMLSAMLDEALSISALSTLNQGEHVVTLEMKVQFVSSAGEGVVHARGRLISRGGRVGFVEGDLTQDAKLIARATATVLIQTVHK